VKANFLGRLAVFYRRRRILILFCLFLLPAVVLTIGLVLLPDLFWDDFVYKYFWGPVVADSEGRPVSGIREGYNVYNTISYALLLAVALYAMYRVVKRLRIEVDLFFILSCLPLFLFGGVARSLEDANLFDGNIQYFFISPLIYVVVGAIFIGACATGIVIRRNGSSWSPIRKTATFSLFIIFLEAVYLSVTIGASSDLHYFLPESVPIVLGAISVLTFHFLQSKSFQPIPSAIMSAGILCLVISISYVVAFNYDEGWRGEFTAQLGRGIYPHISELGTIFGIAIGITLVLWVLGRVTRFRSLPMLFASANLLMFFGHFLDGAATYRGIDIYGYTEKHVLPSFLIEFTGTAATLLIFKFVVVFLIIMIIDFWFREELRMYPNLGNIMKFAIVFLGVAPGTRDAIRIALGV